ncbi:MAG: hypothetical protein ABI718_13790 [Acidobacteriota bacterium]
MKPDADGVAAAIWVMGAALLLSVFLLSEEQPDLRQWTPPETPVSRVDPEYAMQWKLLQQARPFIPIGASFTVRSLTGDSETSLLMLSQGILLRRDPLPWSYFGAPKGEGARAEFVIAQNPRISHQSDLKEIARLPAGRIYRRLK